VTKRALWATLPLAEALGTVIALLVAEWFIPSLPAAYQSIAPLYFRILCAIGFFGLFLIWRQRYQNFTPRDRDLAQEALMLASSMRELDAKYRARENREQAKNDLKRMKANRDGDKALAGELWNEGIAISQEIHNELAAEFARAFVGRAVYLRNEITHRLGNRVDEQQYQHSDYAFKGNLAGPSPISDVATYLELLAYTLLAGAT